MPETIEDLVRSIETEAKRAAFPVDHDVYTRCGADPAKCVLYCGNLESDVAFFARDLGRDEVRLQEPLVGAAGKLVRTAVFRSLGGTGVPSADDLKNAAKSVLLTNTVPWKPPNNLAYSDEVKDRFRPFVTRFLVRHWRGSYLITLGTEAFHYWARYAPAGSLAAFWKREDKWVSEFPVTIETDGADGRLSRTLILAPLPHPSPLNQKYYKQFPAMVAQRLATRPR
jgi:uracil-DNA glycosylase